jgi:hypothetical protein
MSNPLIVGLEPQDKSYTAGLERPTSLLRSAPYIELVPGWKARIPLQGAQMIQLATDPNASRPNWRAAAAEARDESLAARRPRSGHAWPFIARHGDRPARQQDEKRIPSSGS